MYARSCGEAAVRLLEAYGVDTLFGMPGNHTLEFYRGLATSKIRHVLFRHEQGGGFMADGYARVTGRPGVCLLVTGPGLLNAATPIAQAYSDSSPVLVITSAIATEDMGARRGRLHELTSQQAAVAPLTRFSQTILTANQLSAAVHRAFSSFRTRRPRPVHIEIPIDVAAGPADSPLRTAPLPEPPAPSARAVECAARAISRAERPLVLIGGGAVDHGEVARQLAERVGAPMVLTTAAKGSVAASHPLNAGSILAARAGQELVSAADLVVAAGTELSHTDHWTTRLPINGSLVRIDLDESSFGGDYPATVPVLGDAGTVLAMLLEALAARSRPDRAWGEAAARQARAKVQDELKALPKVRSHLMVLDTIRAALPRAGFVATDMTQLGYTADVYLETTTPRSYMHPSGFGALGFAVPAAIGAKLAVPHRPGLAVCGDAGFLFTLQELATAVDEHAPIAILLWNNDGLGQIRDGMIAKGMEPLGVEPRNPDFLGLARAFGFEAARPASLNELFEGLAEAWATETPTLLEVREDAPFL